MARHIMIDLETLHVRTDAVILTIGAVAFDPRGEGIQDSFYIKPDVDEQMTMGRAFDEKTIEWWGQQNQQARDEAFSLDDRVSFKESLQALHAYCWNAVSVWSNGAGFDIPVVELAMYQTGLVCPWRHWEVRDTRTLWDITGVKLRDGGNVTSHRADDDAAKQALAVQRSYRRLIETGLVPAL